MRKMFQAVISVQEYVICPNVVFQVEEHPASMIATGCPDVAITISLP
jgi:hypothetical protein